MTDAHLPAAGAIHHVEIWIPDLARVGDWQWLLQELGYTLHQSWEHGRSWRLHHTYLVLEQSPDLTADRHDRRAPGLNHLAFHVHDESAVDRLARSAPAHGWSLLFADRHPYAGGPQQYAAYLESSDGFEVELVAVRRS
ncbi:VOC family protein [Streptomyces tsukubensis]|uniref:Glyoxalase n=1 Tax=Streptomyces tsukubensis TaxID=83656 RepID=A0A1V4AGZ7_9ACTN|nr:VOC family protein [Streptomyces tsukubensis]OON82958.1 glyoxalase [Streptomyces tsukubensis]QFR91852.1 glyoxalase [Streptomyces tsukubensis]